MYEEVRMIIAQYCGMKARNIRLETDLVKDLKLSSLDVVNLVVAFEDAFDTDIPNVDIRKFRFIKDIVEYLEARV